MNLPESAQCDCGYELRLPADRQTAAMREPLRPRYPPLTVAGWVVLGVVALAWIGSFIVFRGEALGFLILWLGPRSLIVAGVCLVLLIAGRRRG